MLEICVLVQEWDVLSLAVANLVKSQRNACRSSSSFSVFYYGVLVGHSTRCWFSI